MKRAVVLLSGGLDSATCLAVSIQEGYESFGISFDYDQRHRVELESARRVAEALGAADHKTIRVDLRSFGGSALTSEVGVPKHRTLDAMSEAIPVTYVPARNTVFLSLALAYAEVLKANDIFIGVNALDYSGYPDCRPEFIQAFEAMANVATKVAVEENQTLSIHTPLIALSKGEIIKLGLSLNVDYALTHSCYDPTANGRACGSCDSCLLREKGFRENGLEDPALALA